MTRIKNNYFEDSVFIANRKLNERELKEKRLVLESKPIRLGVVLTNRCNLRCVMCPSNRRDGQNTLSRRALENIYELLPYLEKINWQGGEIFLIDYLKDVFRDMLGYPNIVHQITTNGLLLDEEWIALLLNLNVSFTLSIDTVVPETYEYIRKGASFNNLIAKIELLNVMEQRFQKKIDKEIVIVVMRSNLDELELFVDFARKYNFARVAFHPVSHIDSEENIFKNMTPEFRFILNDKMENIRRLGQDANIEIHNRLPRVACIDSSFYEREGPKSEQLFCSLPWVWLWVDASRGGDVTPSCMCKQSLGNIYNDTILKFWNNSKMVAYRNNMLCGKLSLCNEDCVSGLVDPEILHVSYSTT